MEIRDVIHGSITIHRSELPILDSRAFQRLRQIRQLGFAEYSYPTATHNRYVHSLGAMETATQAFDTLFGGPRTRSSLPVPDRVALVETAPEAHSRFRAVTRLAALLHDIGHGPLSHTTEFAMPSVKKLGLGLPGFQSPRQATHEDYTLKLILDSELTPLIEATGAPHGFGPLHVASLIEPSLAVSDDFFLESYPSGGRPISFRPVLQQLISSEMDADRMDYLRRDSWYAGVSYGQFDFDWLVGNLTAHIRDGKCYLGLQHRALYAFEDFLISRFHMFLMVYFHHKSVVYDAMLGEYFASAPGEYELPSDIDAYCECNDAQLYAHLSKSKNPWAKRISEKRPYRMLMELHSGIPATKTAAIEQERLLAATRKSLEESGTHFLSSSSTSELSKYFRKPVDRIFVRYDNQLSSPGYIPLEKCTDLFQRYGEKRVISRLYVEPERLKEIRMKDRGDALAFEDAPPSSFNFES